MWQPFCSLHLFFIGTLVYHYSWQKLGVKPTKHVICQWNMKQIECTMEVGLMMSYNLISCRIEDTSYFLDNRKNIQLHPWRRWIRPPYYSKSLHDDRNKFTKHNGSKLNYANKRTWTTRRNALPRSPACSKPLTPPPYVPHTAAAGYKNTKPTYKFLHI